MNEQFTPDKAKLETAREKSLTFLKKREKWSIILFCIAGVFEVGLFVLMLCFMDFQNRQHWFVFFAVLFVYCPLVTIIWRNSFKIDDLYYRLIHDLKYNQ
jgi:hypothetical protein